MLFFHFMEDIIAVKVKNRINNQIRSPKVRVISEQGEQLGILNIEEAISMAADRGLDLVEIAQTDPPVTKIIDFGKFKYEKERAYKENKKKQKVVVVKTIKIRPQIDLNDLQTKEKQISHFLSGGKKVKVILILRGRQRLHADRGKQVVEELSSKFSEIATIEKNYTAGISLLLTPR